MSEHQQLIAAITTLIAEQKRTTDAINALAGSQTTVKQNEPAKYEDIADAIKEEMTEGVDTDPKHETEPPTAADLKAALMTYKGKTDSATAKAMLTEFGAAKLSDVKESYRQPMIDKMQEASR